MVYKRIFLGKLFIALCVATIPLLASTILRNVLLSYLIFPFGYIVFQTLRSKGKKNAEAKKIGFFDRLLNNLDFLTFKMKAPSNERQTSNGDGETLIKEQKNDLNFEGQSLEEESGPKRVVETEGDYQNVFRVLIADDRSKYNRRIKDILLQEYPRADVTEVSNAYELIVEIENTPKWDVIISDINMPGISGLDALKKIKPNSAFFPHVIFISVNSEDYFALENLESGTEGYIIKSFSESELITAIRSIIEKKE